MTFEFTASALDSMRFGHEHFTDVQLELLWLMQEVSEEHYCANWMDSCEFDFWRMAVNAEASRDWGQDVVPKDVIGRMRSLAEACGGWWAWEDSEPHRSTRLDMHSGCRFVPMNEWLPRFAAWSKENWPNE